SRDELLGFWRWQGVATPPQVDVLHLGADWRGVSRSNTPSEKPTGPKKIVSIGILEPRKNQSVLLDAYEVLRLEGLEFELHLVGRVNPHFGAPIEQRVAQMAARWPGLHHHADMDDSALAALVRSARATAFASLAEGCGLPLLESLWMGVPCICSDIPSLVENAAGGGCLVVPGNNLAGWVEALRKLVTDDSSRMRLAVEAYGRQLPTWANATRTIGKALGQM
ncbi:MAG TPA: glycosyltransferase, partial [Opitutaceae bacterium]